MHHEKLSFTKILALSFMLFALFFGAGNMIFPPSMGQASGTNVWWALLGFILSDGGLSLLGIAAIVYAGTTLTDLAGRVGKKFAVALTTIVYLSIGPMFAIPRTGSVSFELAILPFLPEGFSVRLATALFTACFFLLLYFLSINPQRIVTIVGNILTPVLLGAILLTGLGIMIHPIGTICAPSGNYVDIPFFEGIVQGYQALDVFAAPVFAALVIDNIKIMGVTRRENIVRYTMIAGSLAIIFLGIIYGILAYAGAISMSLGTFPNGGQLLTAISYAVFGTPGVIILGVAVLLACLTTSIGLTTSCGTYFSELYPGLSYRKVVVAVCVFSFLISNVGLTQLISITLPVLLALYPLLVDLIFISFLEPWIHGKRAVYIGTMIGAAIISIPSGIEAFADNYGMSLGIVSEWLAMVPMYNLMLGWVIPAIAGGLIGLVVHTVRNK